MAIPPVAVGLAPVVIMNTHYSERDKVAVICLSPHLTTTFLKGFPDKFYTELIREGKAEGRGGEGIEIPSGKIFNFCLGMPHINVCETHFRLRSSAKSCDVHTSVEFEWDVQLHVHNNKDKHISCSFH